MQNNDLETYAQIIDRFNAKMYGIGMKIQNLSDNGEDLALYILVNDMPHKGDIWWRAYHSWESADEMFFGAKSIFNFFERCYNEFNKCGTVLPDTRVSMCGKQWLVFKAIQGDSLEEILLKMDMIGI